MIAPLLLYYLLMKELEPLPKTASSGKDGTFAGNPTWVAGKRGYALELDGTGDQINVENFKGVTGNGPITVALVKIHYNNATTQQSYCKLGSKQCRLRQHL